MRHDRDLADQDVEEVAEELWALREEGRDLLADLQERSQIEDLKAALDQTVRRDLARLEGDRIVLTAAGRNLGERQVRRHRLAEVLFTTVLENNGEAVNRTACVIEHVLDAALTDSICAFLGHPKLCPHGKSIPPGPCCHALTETLAPLVQPLSQLPIGQEGRIVYVIPREPERLVRLSNLGVVPGAIVRLQQKSPAAVLRVGETTFAVDPSIAGEIYVKRR